MEFNFNDLESQTDKIAVITGANSGIGYETTLMFAQKGIKVIMACRNLERAEAAKSKIIETVPSTDLEIMHLDLSSLASVKEFASKFREKYTKLDILVNNAGIMWVPYSKTMDGFENTLATNYLGHFVLTSLLIDLMPDNSDSRIITLSSLAHKMGTGKINFNDFQSQNKYSKIAAYSQSKLACIMFAFELQRRLEKSNKKILSIPAHPGFSNTELIKNKVLKTLLNNSLGVLLYQSAHDGALPVVMAALSSDVHGGEYYGPTGFMEIKGKPGRAKASEYAKNEEMAAKLWDITTKITCVNFNV